METEKFSQSKLLKGIILGGALFLLIMLIFCIGVFVGGQRAEFSFEWADQYHRNFGGPASGFMGQMVNPDYIGANGVFGQIIKIDSSVAGQSTITIKGADNIERVVSVDDDTTIRLQRSNINLSDLKNGENVVIIGEPTNNGQIEAELIRIMPGVPPVKK